MRKREGRREFRRNRKGSNVNWKGMRRKRTQRSIIKNLKLFIIKLLFSAKP